MKKRERYIERVVVVSHKKLLSSSRCSKKKKKKKKNEEEEEVHKHNSTLTRVVKKLFCFLKKVNKRDESEISICFSFDSSCSFFFLL